MSVNTSLQSDSPGPSCDIFWACCLHDYDEDDHDDEDKKRSRLRRWRDQRDARKRREERRKREERKAKEDAALDAEAQAIYQSMMLF